MFASTRVRTLSLALAVAAPALIGCGGDDGGDEAATATTGAPAGTGATADTAAGAPTGTATGDAAPTTGTAGAPAGGDDACAAFTRYAMAPAPEGGNPLTVLVDELAGVEPPAELADAWAVLTRPGIEDASVIEPDVEAALDEVGRYVDEHCPVPAAPGGP